MSITLDLSGELVEELKRLSATTGQTIEEIVRRGVQAEFARPNAAVRDDEQSELDHLLGYAGCLDSGAANSGDNARIDEDLVRAYSSRGEAA
jgi:hypothetical protein